MLIGATEQNGPASDQQPNWHFKWYRHDVSEGEMGGGRMGQIGRQ